MIPVLIMPPLVFNPAYCDGEGVANCWAALMLILPLPAELMNALGAGAMELADGANPDEVTLLRLAIILPSMYHMRGLLAPLLCVEVDSPVVPAGAALSMFPSLVVSTVSHEKVNSCGSPLSDFPATAAAASQSSLLFHAGTDIS